MYEMTGSGTSMAGEEDGRKDGEPARDGAEPTSGAYRHGDEPDLCEGPGAGAEEEFRASDGCREGRP